MTTMRWDGMEDLQAALRSLPRDLASDANQVVMAAVDGARMKIIEGYPTGPVRTIRGRGRARTLIDAGGTLKRRVFISRLELGPFGAGLTLKSAAPHAWWFEHGTQARHTARRGPRGSMPANHLFSRTVVRARRAMWHALAEMMRKHGLQVTEHGV